MKAVIYARYSSHNQKEESIEGQLRECKEFAEKNEIQVIGEYCDRALSGKTDKRPQFQKMIRDSAKGTFQAVIMYTLDRFARNRYDSAIYKARLKKNGVRVFYAKQPMPDTPEGIILESILEGYAEYYSENLSRNVKRGMRERAMKGFAVGQQPPLGYYIGDDKRFHVDPIGSKVVNEIFELYASGKSKKEISKYCNEQGYKTSAGNDFVPNSLTNMLRNEKYIGIYKFAEITVDDAIPPIIDKDLYARVQERVKKNAHMKARKKAKEEYLLTTKLFCGHCGSIMIGESGTSKTGKTYNYYKCACRKRKGTCDKTPEPKNALENFIVQYVVHDILTNENIDLIATETYTVMKKEAEDNSYANELKAKLHDTEKQIANIIRAIEQGIITDSMKDRLQELENEKEYYEIKLDEDAITKDIVLTKEQIAYFLTTLRNGYIENTDYKQKIIDTLVNSVYVYDDPDGGKKITLNINTSRNNSHTVKSSDFESFATPCKNTPCAYFFAEKHFCFTPPALGIQRITDNTSISEKQRRKSWKRKISPTTHLISRKSSTASA